MKTEESVLDACGFGLNFCSSRFDWDKVLLELSRIMCGYSERERLLEFVLRTKLEYFSWPIDQSVSMLMDPIQSCMQFTKLIRIFITYDCIRFLMHPFLQLLLKWLVYNTVFRVVPIHIFHCIFQCNYLLLYWYYVFAPCWASVLILIPASPCFQVVGNSAIGMYLLTAL